MWFLSILCILNKSILSLNLTDLKCINKYGEFEGTYIFKSARLFTDGHYGPDENLQTAEGTHTYTQCFAPGREHIGAVVQGRTVHLDENVGQDELYRENNLLAFWI